MKKFIPLVLILCAFFNSKAQRLLSWAPEFPNDNSTLTFTVDCTKGNQGLLNFEGGNSANVFVHLGVNTNLSTGPGDWKYVKFPNFNAPNAAANATALGGNKYSYTITNIRSFFNVPAGETINKVNIIFRNGPGTLKQVNSDVSDMYLPVYPAGQFAVRLNLPPFEPRFNPFAEPINVAVGSTVTITGVATNNAALTLKLNGTTINTAASATTISATPTIPTACEQKIMYEGNDGTGLKKDSFSFFIPPTTTIAPIPAGMIEGINYAANNTSATLVLFAPNKNTVNVIGDFNNWQPTCASQMNKTADGNYYWITLNSLTPGTEYGFQYLVDNTIKIADPYCQKILDQFNDPFISNVTYPNLKPYPVGLTSGLVGILQTAEPQYTWQVNNFAKPDKRNLVAYELLIRDFTAEHSYQSLIDSIQYIKGIGINAIELMPINEFDNNESWGYNPSFYFAPDKYYGTKNKLKEFIDICHVNGIAVILDVVYNHATGNAPQAALYWNAATNQPAPNNPWMNVTATHPYNVFNDFNHNSTATKYLFTRNLNFWLDEYKVDGFRFDLAKGFSQTITNTTTVENYDPARVANLKYYYNNSVPTHPNTYMILEFLGTTPSQEEQEYAAHGFMLWGNMNSQYNQCTMGYTTNSNISNISYNSSGRSFNNPALFGYMQSHDEERTMFKNLQNGNSNGGYDAKNLNTALAREEAAAAVFFTVPGPKMIWQFEERGYDVSLFFGGSNVANKPPRWEYMLNPNRKKLYDSYKKMIDFRLANQNIFNNTNFNYDFFDGGGLVKSLRIEDPNTAGKKVVVVANMDVTTQTRTITFQATGNWFNYIANGTGTGINGTTDNTFNLTNASQSITLAPGEYHIYVSIPACTTTAPTSANNTINYCLNATATPLTATGTNLLWYTTASGGTGATVAPTPLTTTAGNTIFYVSQTNTGAGACEGPRLAITVVVAPATAAPTVATPVTYCQNATAVALTASGSNLKWYTVAIGGASSTTAPIPNTTTLGNTMFYVSQTIGNCEGARAAITVTVNTIPTAPTVATPIAYCQNATATALTATGSNILWYTVATGGTSSATAPIPNTTIVGNTSFYVSQTTNSCESQRAAIVINVNAVPTAPLVNTPITYCQNATATALTATGSNLLWYNNATGGTGISTAPIPNTNTIGSTNFFVSQTNNTCESPRAQITVTITATTPAPTVTSNIAYCQNATAVPLTATGTNLLWYQNATGGTGNTVAPTPNTSTIGSTIFYVSQTQSCGESPRAAITVTVNAIPNAPNVTSPIAYCQNATATPLTATGSNLLWYTVATGGTSSTLAPTPLTTTVGTTTFYVSQTSNNCESPRAAIVVNINATPNNPTATSPLNYCQGQAAAQLTASGTNLLWYTIATGGPSSTTAPIPNTTTAGTFNFYVSQTSNNCESGRTNIVVAVAANTVAPTVTTPVTYCQNTTAVPLTATGTNLLWYANATGGVGSTTAPTPSTSVAGNTTFYVSQTGSCGEGPRALIVVTINATPSTPTVTTPVTYCQNSTAIALTATGTNLLWFSTATGGTGNTTAPTPITTTVGSTAFYVNQSINNCPSARAVINIVVNTTPAAPSTNATVTYCQNSTATPLAATGTNLLWYTVATGGTGSSTAPTPTTTTTGNSNFFVSQTTGNCESPRTAIQVTITALPAAPIVTTPITYCQNTVATALTATGANLVWYLQPLGGTASANAPIPITTTAGTTNYYVASVGCAEGPRALLAVTVSATPAAPTNLNVTNLTFNSATLNWQGTAGSFYTVEYKLNTAANFTTVATGITANTFTATGLILGGNYEWRVSANCAATGLGNGSAVQSFTTLARNTTLIELKNGFGIKVSPNPVSERAFIDYLVPGTGNVSITVLNEKGQIIRTFIEGNRTPGQYQRDITAELNILARATYFLRLVQNNKGISTKFIKL